jgi:DNA-binding NarL/FixJ family response regulator
VASHTTAAAAGADNDGAMPTTLLIVDDHPGFRSAARQLLQQHGYEVVGEVGDGESALDAVPTLRPDVVLLDVQLPGIDGFEVASRLPEDVAVVMVSSRDAADFGRLVERADGFIPKHELSGPALDAALNAAARG